MSKKTDALKVLEYKYKNYRYKNQRLVQYYDDEEYDAVSKKIDKIKSKVRDDKGIIKFKVKGYDCELKRFGKSYIQVTDARVTKLYKQLDKIKVRCDANMKKLDDKYNELRNKILLHGLSPDIAKLIERF